LPRDVWRTLKIEAARQDKSAAALIRDGLAASALKIREREAERAS
jgi:plasmid stability protein